MPPWTLRGAAAQLRVYLALSALMGFGELSLACLSRSLSCFDFCFPLQVLLEVLSAKARSVGSSEEMLRECMRVAANAWALKTALDALDDWTIDQVKPEAASSAVAAAAAQVRLTHSCLHFNMLH